MAWRVGKSTLILDYLTKKCVFVRHYPTLTQSLMNHVREGSISTLLEKTDLSYKMEWWQFSGKFCFYYVGMKAVNLT